MILLVLLTFLCYCSEASFCNTLRPHLSDSLRIKCDTLPYRTAFVENRCYFAVGQEVKLDEASAQCSSILPGSTVEVNAPNKIFIAMMLEKSRFHLSMDSSGAKFRSSGAKQSICVLDTGYKCSVGEQSGTVPGKCLASSETKRNFVSAQRYCERYGMYLPTVENELENHMIRAAIPKDLAWLRHPYDGATKRKWSREKYYAKFSTCHRPHVLYAGWDMTKDRVNICTWNHVAVIDTTGYWGFNALTYQYGTVCVKDAENDFNRGGDGCVEMHERDKETGLCEWTGHKDACIQLVDYTNKTQYMLLPNFPTKTFIQHNLYATRSPMNDVVSKAIVRRGCMFTGYAHHIDHGEGKNEWFSQGNINNLYGAHNVPSYYTGDIANAADGLTRVSCYCDPTEANLNDHEPEPPKRKKCIQHHTFNETTQSCEWDKDPKFCGELISNDGRRQMIEIPNWPTNRRYDVDHWNNLTKREENFHVTVTEIIVRQHCWATLLQWAVNSRQTLPTTGYGKHAVLSHYTGQLGSPHDGTHRVICECMR